MARTEPWVGNFQRGCQESEGCWSWQVGALAGALQPVLCSTGQIDGGGEVGEKDRGWQRPAVGGWR